MQAAPQTETKARAPKKSAPTKTAALPAGTEAVARALLDLLQARAVELVEQAEWYRTAPAEFKTSAPTVTFERVEMFKVYTSIGIMDGETYDAPFAVFSTVVGPYRATFRMRIEFGANGVVYMDEVAA